MEMGWDGMGMWGDAARLAVLREVGDGMGCEILVAGDEQNQLLGLGTPLGITVNM